MGGRGGSGERNDFAVLSSDRDNDYFFDDMSRNWGYNLTNAEEVALSEYTMYNNQQINDYLREGKISDFTEEELKRQATQIKSALDKFDLTEGLTLYRAGNSGSIIKEFKSFVSTSTDIKLAEKYLGNRADTLYIIQVSKGKGKGAYVAPKSEVPEEHEFLLNRGLRPTVVSRSKKTINGKNVKVITIRV